MMTTDESLYRFPARMESLEALLSHVEKAATGTDRGTVLRAQTAIEELFANSVLYGNAGNDEQAAVWLAVQPRNGRLHLRYEDAFAAFDPFHDLENVVKATELPMEERAIGGVGRLLVYQLADHAHYERQDERNCIQLLFAPRAAG